jgi:transposase-like protein
MIAADLRKRRPKPHATWHLDEVYLKIAPHRRSSLSRVTPSAVAKMLLKKGTPASI